MPGQRPILAMSFVASVGILCEVLACTLPKGQANFWPLLVLLFYILLPIPLIISRRIMKETVLGMTDTSTGHIRDCALFFTSGLMVSSLALPIVMARSPEVKPLISVISCFLVELGNILCYLTMALFCMYFKPLSGL